MKVYHWVLEHGFDVIGALGIIGGLVFTAISFRSEAKTRRVANLLTLTQNHHELWKVFFKDFDVARVLDPNADVAKQPITIGESAYINVMIQHLSSVHRAMQTDLTIKPEGVKNDVRDFFALPLPKAFWSMARPFQNQDFAEFVEQCLK
jgi:hypothetical protein